MSRPKIISFSTASIDGKLTLAPDVLLLYGDARWDAVAGSADGAYHHIMTDYKPQAILEGSGSLMLEGQPSDPLPPVEGDPADLYQDYLPTEIVDRPGQRGWLTVVDGRGRVRWLYKEFPGEDWEGWHVLVLAARQTPPEYLAYLQREKIPYLVAGEERVDLSLAVEKQASQLGVSCLVSSGGGKMSGALLRAGLIDEIEVEFFPAAIGGCGTPALFDAPPLKKDEMPVRLELVSANTLPAGHVRLKYRVVPKE